MSAFIVEDATINRIVNWLRKEIVRSPYSLPLREKLTELGYDLTDPSNAEKLANNMFEMNVSAVAQRYQEAKANHRFTYSKSTVANPVQTLKSLECWLYQCTEGNIPKRALYTFFRDFVERYLLKSIVLHLPEYDQAEWA